MSSKDQNANDGQDQASSLEEAAGDLSDHAETTNQPAASSQPSPAARGALDQLREAAVPESAEQGRGWMWATGRVGFLLVGALLGTLVSASVQLAFDASTAETQEKIDDEARSTVDDGKPPFSWKLSPSFSKNEPGGGWALNRRLTPEERSRLYLLNADGRAIWNYVKVLGGRQFAPRDYYLQLSSERDTLVVITKITATATRCWESNVKTGIVAWGGGGGSQEWERVRFDLAGTGTPVPWKVKDPERQLINDQFTKAITLGGTREPGLVRLSATSPRACDWKLDLTFNVNSGKTQHRSITKDEYGRKLTLEASKVDRDYDCYHRGEDEWDRKHAYCEPTG